MDWDEKQYTKWDVRLLFVALAYCNRQPVYRERVGRPHLCYLSNIISHFLIPSLHWGGRRFLFEDISWDEWRLQGLSSFKCIYYDSSWNHRQFRVIFAMIYDGNAYPAHGRNKAWNVEQKVFIDLITQSDYFITQCDCRTIECSPAQCLNSPTSIGSLTS